MKKYIFICAAGLLSFTACKTSNEPAASKSLEITMEPKSGSKMFGKAVFTEKNGKVQLVAHFEGMEPGVHAIHIHEKSDCSAPDATSAGGHWNPTFKAHGKWGDAEHHRGDIGNFAVNENGEGTVIFETDQWAIGGSDATKDILGKSLMVHADPDDFHTQPTGNAGARIACSAIIK
jgi:Cu-Zn family superoxide dismutase